MKKILIPFKDFYKIAKEFIENSSKRVSDSVSKLAFVYWSLVLTGIIVYGCYMKQYEWVKDMTIFVLPLIIGELVVKTLSQEKK